MNNFIKLLGVLVVTVVIPLAVLLGIWANILPQSLQVYIAAAAVIASIVFIVGGNLYLMWDDIRSGRYSKRS
ncbi:hypothetical protein [Thiomicrospira sp. WB1]|uniref:hypothetical protein n=1 Tax=Thiomicrospira sp. WB1 TaxID=1685380 RepID=UPI00074ABA71|nr:hypothetical protein [Thiomicrospira sp. WB1]KUJ72540.1 hypothetical protein AVO41_01660 [Thiomicrospira sp. WB1]